MTTEWRSEQDVENDMWSYSEIEQSSCQDEDVPIPRTIEEYNKRIGANNNPSIFENPFATEDLPTINYSGRGRGARNFLITPGDVPKPDASINTDLGVKKKLRQVAGLGHSNELIEQSYKAATNKSSIATFPKIKFQPVQSTSSAASNASTPSSMSRIHSPSTSKSSSACATPNKSNVNNLSMSSTSSSSSRSSTPPKVEEPESLEVEEKEEKAPSFNPVPLSVMLKLAKKDMKKVKENPKNKTEVNGEREERAPNPSVELNVDAPEWLPNGNDFWWNRRAERPETRRESNSWRRDTNSPNRYFTWNSNWNREHNSFNIDSSKDFPALK